jgi:hypothetical protein
MRSVYVIYPTGTVVDRQCETASQKRQLLLIFGISYCQTGTCRRFFMFFIVLHTLPRLNKKMY